MLTKVGRNFFKNNDVAILNSKIAIIIPIFN